MFICSPPTAGLVKIAAIGTMWEPRPPPFIVSAVNTLSKVSPVVLAAIPADVQALLREFPTTLHGVHAQART